MRVVAQLLVPLVLFAVSTCPALAAESAPAKAPGAGNATRADAGRPVPPQAAFAAILVEAEKGDGAAMLRVGSLYENGYGTDRNFGKALEWYKKAADAGMPEGIYNVGVCYEIGMGTAVNLDRAVAQYRLAAEKGLPQAYYKLAVMYLNGHGLPKDRAKGLEALNKAAGDGHVRALNDLGMLYLNGLFDLKQDGEAALKHFTAAADLGSLDAMRNLVVIYGEGLGGLAKDPVQAYKWYLICKRAGMTENMLPPENGVTAGLDAAGKKVAEKAAADWVAAWEKKQAAAR